MIFDQNLLEFMSLSPLNSAPKAGQSHPLLPTYRQTFFPPKAIDTLELQATSFPKSFIDVKNRLVQCLKNLWSSIVNCFSSKTKLHSITFGPLTIIPSQYPHHISNANKQFVYNYLVRGRNIDDPVTVTKWGLKDPRPMNKLPLFATTKPQIVPVDGPFRYEASTADTVHWTANFADRNLFGFCEGPLLAQDELQVLEHPALAHVKNALPAEQRILEPLDTVLFQNVPRLGALDALTPIPAHDTQILYANYFATPAQAEILSRLTRSLYGNYFTNATQREILTRLTPFSYRTSSNIFAIVAPHISSALEGQPYQKKDLGRLFFTFYNASQSIKVTCPGKKIVLHTGNWGCGAFGNDPKTVYILQMAAARFAGIDELQIHPLSHQNELQAARQLLDQIEQRFPQMTVDQFIDHLQTHAAEYGLTYKRGNGT
jgi:hypothetical protein